MSTSGPYNPFPLATTLATPGTPAAPEPDAVGETPLSDIDFLRMVLQEPIPAGGADTDTLFLNEQLVAIWNRANNVLSIAAWMGWTIKAGALAVLTDRNDGLSEKKLSQAALAAQKISEMYRAQAEVDAKQLSRTLGPAAIVFRPYDESWSDLWNQVWDVSHIDRFYLPWNVIEG